MYRKVKIYEVSNEAIKKSKQPKWKCSFGKSMDGMLFFPAALFGDEDTHRVLASYDCADFTMYRGHFFINHEWLLKEKKGIALELVNVLIGVANP